MRKVGKHLQATYEQTSTHTDSKDPNKMTVKTKLK